MYLFDVLVMLEPNLTEFLFLLTSKLRERLPDKSFPIKKVKFVLFHLKSICNIKCV